MQHSKQLDERSKRLTRKNSQDWEWRPREKGHLPIKGKRDESQDIVDSSMAILGSAGGSMTEARVEPGWRINDILLAARVLQNTRPSPNYANEAEMRRVFGLVYDVLRCEMYMYYNSRATFALILIRNKYTDKNILNRTLEDGGFWYRNGALKLRERVVWLLLYDMQGRKFARRRAGSATETREKIFERVGLKDIEDALLKAKTHLAASISRLRIGGSALNLDQLLPAHLRIAEGISWADKGAIASGWINTIKVLTKSQFVQDMSKLNLQLCEEAAELYDNKYVFDPICPKMINLHDKAREKLAMSDLARDHRFIFLERSLCLGAATLAQAIRVARLCGPVILTHSIAPRHTGYLAGLLADIEDAGRLLAFGAGDGRCEHEAYLTTLGVTLQQCRIFSEKYIAPPPSVELERATVVLATPPCSYTGVRDVVDLAVARGGDTNLLESLTSDTAGEIKQPRALLAEQFSTLKYALTRPNIQFLIYEVHTILPSETTEMIRQVVEYANRLATEKYIREHPPKRKTLLKDTSGKMSKMATKSDRQEESREHWEERAQDEQMFVCKQEDEEDEKLLDTTDVIPDSDLFEVGTIDDIYGENNQRVLDPGCFIAIIKRKEMMQFDSLFMIKVAEAKGLFGDPDKERQTKQKTEMPAAAIRQSSRINRRGCKRVKVEIDRLAAPTHAWMLRATNKRQLCPRHSRRIVRDEKLLTMQVRETRKRDARRWWRDAIAFLTDSERRRDTCAFQFYATRSDPFTQKPLYPSHEKKMALSRCYRRFRRQNLAVDS
ncbi:PREDICTED: uncharacterized protein LOC105565196 isoform X2 [Vollenhovia emeryi]|uniref:uncharacterized protein LOC105565196 isoform X2 n=1 Tax=Vollenhovia emeryi TaxID=411798 RepID=UPI0005F4557A|nr:PREDICTED: uncharacterized protein LOC105565196 isoform X2 [Vollenhovia emeryi]